jgi:cyclopropane fatty-acyl-phospholipid synthase-like methyltransferase
VSQTGESLHDLKKPLSQRDQENLFQLQLYHRCVVTSGTLKQRSSVLDLGCGRGGGLAFLAEHFDIIKATGVDLCSRQISFAQQTFKSATFIHGDVECLDKIPQLAMQQYDMILCVEAWHTLPNTLETLRQSAALLSKDSDSRLVIADGFDVTLIQECEAEFSKYFEIC